MRVCSTMRITTHEREEVSAGPFCGLVVVDLRRLLDKLLPGINVLWRQEYKVLTYHTEIKHNFYTSRPIKGRFFFFFVNCNAHNPWIYLMHAKFHQYWSRGCAIRSPDRQNQYDGNFSFALWRHKFSSCNYNLGAFWTLPSLNCKKKM